MNQNPYVSGGLLEFYVLPQDFFQEIERATSRDLEALLTAEEKTQYGAVLVRRTGAAAHEILDYLREQGDIDLVVMATHGRGGAARLMMGSVADRVVRAAPCPVLTIRAAGDLGGRANCAA